MLACVVSITASTSFQRLYVDLNLQVFQAPQSNHLWFFVYVVLSDFQECLESLYDQR